MTTTYPPVVDHHAVAWSLDDDGNAHGMAASAAHGFPEDHAPRHDPAEFRCTSLALGLREDELTSLLGVEARAIDRYNRQINTVPAAVIATLNDVRRAAAQLVVQMTEQAADTGLITTARPGDDATATRLTDVAIRFASVHRVCAGRVAAADPDIRVVTAEADPSLDVAFACKAAALGLGLKQLRARYHHGDDAPFVANPRTVQDWVTGRRTPITPAVDDIDRLHLLAHRHRDELAAQGSEHGTIAVAATAEQLHALWPESGLPLVTHQIAAARAAAQSGRPLVFATSAARTH